MPGPPDRLPKGGWISIIAISITQLVGWATTFNFPAILARPMAADLGMPLSSAFAAPTAFLIAFAIASPFLAPLYLRIGAGPLLIAGSCAASLCLALLAWCTSEIAYYLIWGLLGICGTMMLSTAAHSRLTELFGTSAKRWITAVMLITGLSATVGYPVTQYLNETLGWRQTIMIFALAHLVLCLPLHILSAMTGKRVVAFAAPDASGRIPRPELDPRELRLFLLLCLALSVSGFLSWGMFVVMIELFRASGLTPLQALSIASALGPIQVAARFAEFVFAPRASGLLTNTLATGAMPVAFIVLLLGEGSLASAWIFILVYGTAMGALSVGRATLPLELFDARTYGYHMSRMSLPLYLSFAAGAPVLMALIEFSGARTAMMFGLGASLFGLACMVVLRQAALRSPPVEKVA